MPKEKNDINVLNGLSFNPYFVLFQNYKPGLEYDLSISLKNITKVNLQIVLVVIKLQVLII